MKAKRIGIIAVILAALVIIGFNYDYLTIHPFQDIQLNAPNLAVDLSDGRKLAADQSGKRILMVGEDGKIQFIRFGKRGSVGKFYEAKDMLEDSQGNIYVLDIRRKDSGRRVDAEKIIKYKAGGKSPEIIQEIQYGEEKVFKNAIYKLDKLGDTVIWFQFTDNGFGISSEAGVIKSWEYEDAANMIVDFAVNPVTETVSFITKYGEIMEEQENGDFAVRYSVEGKEGYWIPWDLDYDNAGNLYYADLGQRSVYQIDEAGNAVKLILGGQNELLDDISLEELKEYSIMYQISAEDDLMATDTYGIISLQGEELSYEFSYEMSLELRIRCLLAWISALILMFASAAILVWGMLYIKNSSSVDIKIITGLLVGTLGLTGLFTMIIMKNWNERMTSEMLKRTYGISQMAADMVPGDNLKMIDSIDDYMNEDYQMVRDSQREIFMNSNMGTDDLYCVIYKIQDGMITLVYSVEDYPGAVYPYDWPYEGSDEQMIIENQVQKHYMGLSTTEGSFLFVLSPILDSQGETVGIMEVGTELYAFQQDNRNMVMQVSISAFVIAIVVILMTFEVLVFIQGNKELQQRGKDKKKLPVSMTRVMVFAIFFLTNMPRGFLPIYIIHQAETEYVFGLSSELLLSLALSSEVLLGAIMSFKGDILIRWWGRRKAAIFGALTFTFGLGMRAVVPTILSVIIGNAIMGAGWGIILLLVQIMIAECKEEEEKTEGFSGYTAASLGGVNAGVVFGAFLINWLSYRMIFAVIGVLSLLVLMFCWLYIVDADETAAKEMEEVKGMSTIRFLASPRVFTYFIGIVIPVVAAGYFLSYLYPILAEGYYISEANIGYSYLINGLCIICFGGVLTRMLIKKVNKKNTLVLSSILYAAAFIIYAVYPHILTLLLTLLLLGLSDGFGLPTQGNYYTDLKEVEEYGYDRAMGVYSLLENSAQVFGSFIFGVILVRGVEQGLMAAGVVILVCAALFWIFGQNKKGGMD